MTLRSRKFTHCFALIIFAALIPISVVWPAFIGDSFFFRDIATTHRPAWVLSEQIGVVKMNPAASFGQPFRGNPNLLLLYPFPKSARGIDAHVVVHLMLLAAGMALWLRRRVAAPAALFGAVVFILSGYVLSASSSINSLTTIAWIPWVLLCSVNRDKDVALHTVVRVLVLAIFSISGEPVLITAGVVLAAAVSWRTDGTRATARFVAAVVAALILTVPIHRETFLTAQESERVVRGYDSSEALTQSLHPARLVETIIPKAFGDPSRLASGGWWGYRVSNGVRPYVYSTAFGLLPVALTLIYGLAVRFQRHRGWWVLLLVSTEVAIGGYLPGVHILWEAVPLLHVIRYPIKALLFATLALSVLAAQAFDALSSLSSKALRRRIARWISAFAVIPALIALLLTTHRSAVMNVLQKAFWDGRWRGDPDLVLASWPSMAVERLLGISALLLVLFFWIARRPRPWMQAVLILAAITDLAVSGRSLLPTIAPTTRASSPITQEVRRIGGRVFERAFKDLDVPLYGLLGTYPEDHVRSLALAQARQAWALGGAAAGLRYAYDSSADGSYTWRNQMVARWLDDAPWPLKVKWLRSAGVATVIASNVREPLPGLRVVLRHAAVGVPVTLYAVESRLPELRAPSTVRWAGTPEAAMLLFAEDNFDEQREILIEGVAPHALDQPRIAVRAIRNEPDRVVFQSRAARAGFVFLARSYTRQVRASTAFTPLRVLPANVHLCGIEVPAGEHIVTVVF